MREDYEDEINKGKERNDKHENYLASSLITNKSTIRNPNPNWKHREFDTNFQFQESPNEMSCLLSHPALVGLCFHPLLSNTKDESIIQQAREDRGELDIFVGRL